MSHPDPKHDPENVREDDSKFSPRAKALRKKAGKTVKPFADGVKGLRQMLNQPASKHWFARVKK